MNGGKKQWYFADGYLPEKVDNGPAEAHEALMFFNTCERDSPVVIDIYFSDRPPVRGIKVTAPAERVIASPRGSIPRITDTPKAITATVRRISIRLHLVRSSGTR